MRIYKELHRLGKKEETTNYYSLLGAYIFIGGFITIFTSIVLYFELHERPFVNSISNGIFCLFVGCLLLLLGGAFNKKKKEQEEIKITLPKNQEELYK